jgi:hypothetical protein
LGVWVLLHRERVRHDLGFYSVMQLLQRVRNQRLLLRVRANKAHHWRRRGSVLPLSAVRGSRLVVSCCLCLLWASPRSFGRLLISALINTSSHAIAIATTRFYSPALLQPEPQALALFPCVERKPLHEVLVLNLEPLRLLLGMTLRSLGENLRVLRSLHRCQQRGLLVSLACCGTCGTSKSLFQPSNCGLGRLFRHLHLAELSV